MWIVFGVLIGLLAAILFYWKEVVAPAHQAKTSPDIAQHHVVPPPPKKAQKSTTTPEFDFYTVLPKAEIASATRSVAAKTATAAPVVASASPAVTTQPAPAVHSSPPAALSRTLGVTAQTSVAVAPAPVIAPVAAPIAAAPTMPAALPPASVLAEKTAPLAAPAHAVVAAPVASVPVKAPPAKNPASTNYLLQMGLAKNYVEADRLKAELTMSGFDVTIQPFTINGQIHHRVVMGPYPSKAAASQQQALLQKSAVTSVLIKVP